MRIKIRVPKEKEKWMISFGKGSFRRRNSPGVIINAIRHYLHARELKEKLSILVKYDRTTSNETVKSKDKQYLIYATVCFLEDYLKPEYILKEENKWKDYLKRSNV